MLFKTHRNELFELVAIKGLDPLIFSEHHLSNHYGLEVKGSPFKFDINEGSTTSPYVISTAPGIGKTIRRTRRNQKSWAEIKDSFLLWLTIVGKELNAPDLWDEAAKTAQLFAPTTEPTDDKFTRAELAEVQGQLRQLQQSFAASALPEAARQKLIELTQTAAVKAETLTKKDWQNWIIGGFISALTGLLLNPTQAGEVLKLVKAAFGGLFLH